MSKYIWVSMQPLCYSTCIVSWLVRVLFTASGARTWLEIPWLPTIKLDFMMAPWICLLPSIYLGIPS